MRMILVVSGKGGVGKTSLSINIGFAMAHAGQKVLIVDGDFGLSSIDVFLGLQPVATLQHVLIQGKRIETAIAECGQGIKVLTGGSGTIELANLGPEAMADFIATVKELGGEYNILIVDGGSGMGAQVQAWMKSADECLFVATPDPASLMAIYATAKTQFGINPTVQAWLVLNQAESETQGQQLSLKMKEILGRFLNRPARILPSVPYDKSVAKATRMRIPFMRSYPLSGATRATKLIAQTIVAGFDAAAPQTIVGRVKGMIGLKKAA